MIEKKINFRLMTEDEIEEVCILIMRVFNEFVAPEYSELGNKNFADYVNPDQYRKRFVEDNFTFVAVESDRIIGMVEFRANSHLSLMFVDKEWQGKGISRKLFELGLNKCLKNETGIKKISVHSSLYAIPMYEAMGFQKTGEEILEDGIRYIPMEFLIK